MYNGKTAVFDALCVHQDEVCLLPGSACLLAGNEFSAVQAAEITDGDRSFWGVQYHPEYDLSQIATLFSRGAERLVSSGFASTVADAQAIAGDFMALHHDAHRKDLAWRYGIGPDILDPDRHRRELFNWLRVKVLPRSLTIPLEGTEGRSGPSDAMKVRKCHTVWQGLSITCRENKTVEVVKSGG